tara:strand:+ start:122 stop:487 length:366 start_codon:yes stop_codon:yes gene_type:complete
MSQKDTKKMACLHYSHDLKFRAHDLFKVDFKRGSSLAIFKGIIDYVSNNKDLALKIAQHINLFMPKTQSATVKATKSLSRASVGASKKDIEQQSNELLATMKATNPELYAVMIAQAKKEEK